MQLGAVQGHGKCEMAGTAVLKGLLCIRIVENINDLTFFAKQLDYSSANDTPFRLQSVAAAL